VAGIAGFYYLQGGADVLRVLSVLLGLVLAAAVLWTSEPGKNFFVFAKESVQKQGALFGQPGKKLCRQPVWLCYSLW